MYNFYQPQQQQQTYAGNLPYMQNQSQYGAQISASPQFLKGRLVSSIEEAKAAQIDFDGSLFIFPDIANKKIYTKCINMDGTSSLNVYGIMDIPQPPSTDNYVTKKELEDIIEQLKQDLSSSKKPSINF